MSEIDDPLTIPDFLLRPKKRHRKAKPIPFKVPALEIVLPTGDWKLHWLHLNDELPRLGSGRRLIYLWEGRKWAHIISCDSGKRMKVEKSILKTLKPKPMEDSDV